MLTVILIETPAMQARAFGEAMFFGLSMALLHEEVEDGRRDRVEVPATILQRNELPHPQLV